MNNMVLKSNSNVTIGDSPMVLLPLDIYEKITKGFDKMKSKSFLAVASESSLSKDWLKDEEEKAWQNL